MLACVVFLKKIIEEKNVVCFILSFKHLDGRMMIWVCFAFWAPG